MAMKTTVLFIIDHFLMGYFHLVLQGTRDDHATAHRLAASSGGNNLEAI